MSHTVRSSFSVSSKTLDAKQLSRYLPWEVVEAVNPHDKIDFFLSVFDLGVGQHDRVDRHLEKATEELLKKAVDLEKLMQDCQYTLWVQYRFTENEGAINVPYLLSSRLAHLQVELVFHLNEF